LLGSEAELPVSTPTRTQAPAAARTLPAIAPQAADTAAALVAALADPCAEVRDRAQSSLEHRVPELRGLLKRLTGKTGLTDEVRKLLLRISKGS